MTIFFIGDTHFHHENILRFEPVRNFSCIEDMNETLVNNWNKVVGTNDKVYHLGDVSFAGKSTAPLAIVGRLRGKKRLILGNHDRFPILEYAKYFEQIWGVKNIEGLWLTHVPAHPQMFEQQRVRLNIHGHIHSRVIEDIRYLNVSVERIDYRPIALDDIRTQLAAV